ncbi:hypothetical protein ACF0H5_024298 [Mactra antiquata]
MDTIGCAAFTTQPLLSTEAQGASNVTSETNVASSQIIDMLFCSPTSINKFKRKSPTKVDRKVGNVNPIKRRKYQRTSLFESLNTNFINVSSKD